MQLISIKGKDVTLLYDAAGEVPEVGESVALLDMRTRDKGVVVQIVSHETIQYEGLLAEMIQRSLESQAAKETVVFNREMSMDQIKNLKVAIGKIRKTIRGSAWQSWDGYIPSRNVEIVRLSPDEVINHVVPAPQYQIAPFAKYGDQIVCLDGPLCDLISAIVGIKGGGKSHVAKQLAVALSSAGVPVIIFDVNAEYGVLPSAQVLTWQRGFRLNLAEVGWQTLSTVIDALCPLQEGSSSEGTFQNVLPRCSTSAWPLARAGNSRSPWTFPICSNTAGQAMTLFRKRS